MRETLTRLLSAAYAVEKKSLILLQKHLDITDDCDVQMRLQGHLVETRWQSRLLETVLEHYNLDKNPVDRQDYPFFSEIGKSSLFAFERFEIELYKKLIGAAREAQEPEIQQVCKEILEQERAMAEWIEDNACKINWPLAGQNKALFQSLSV